MGGISYFFRVDVILIVLVLVLILDINFFSYCLMFSYPLYYLGQLPGHTPDERKVRFDLSRARDTVSILKCLRPGQHALRVFTHVNATPFVPLPGAALLPTHSCADSDAEGATLG